MFSGLYPLAPHAYRALRAERSPPTLGSRPRWAAVKTALAEWGASALASAVRPAGFFPLPSGTGPRPIILIHGYAMNRANFLVLAYRLREAGLGPVYGFEYWTLGRVAAGARKLGWFVDEVREATGATHVDLVGHSMGGVVARYYVSLAGGDRYVHRLITLGSPHAGTDLGNLGIGHPARELVTGSSLAKRLVHLPAPLHAKLTTIMSNADALVPAAQQPALAGAERIVYDDLGHVALLGSRRVARDVISRLAL